MDRTFGSNRLVANEKASPLSQSGSGRVFNRVGIPFGTIVSLSHRPLQFRRYQLNKPFADWQRACLYRKLIYHLNSRTMDLFPNHLLYLIPLTQDGYSRAVVCCFF